MKAVNATILRLLENCDSTLVFCSLILLLGKYKDTPATNKMPELIVKCILKLTKVIGISLPGLEVGELLICIHEYLLTVQPHPPYKSPHDEIGVKIVKTIVSELVKAKKESIWEDYKRVETHSSEDPTIKRWIAIILKSMLIGGEAVQTTIEPSPEGRVEADL